MKVFFSMNNPGDYVISESSVNEDLVHSLCLKAAGPKVSKLILEAKDKFISLPDYPGHYFFYGELPEEKPHHKPLPEVKPLTFTLGEALKEALN